MKKGSKKITSEFFDHLNINEKETTVVVWHEGKSVPDKRPSNTEDITREMDQETDERPQLSLAQQEDFLEAASKHPKARVSNNLVSIDSEIEKEIIGKILLVSAVEIELPPVLYKNVNAQYEFGISRFIADRVVHLRDLLAGANVTKLGLNSYEIKSLGLGDQQLSFSYRFTANDDRGAIDIAKGIKNQLTGIMQKIWLACWEIGGQLLKKSFEVSVIDLMKKCYPNRKANFSQEERKQFYDTVRAMEPAKFIHKKEFPLKNGEKGSVRSVQYMISMIKVVATTKIVHENAESDLMIQEEDKIQTIHVNLFDVDPIPQKYDKSAYIGAPIKRSTLEISAKDISFATYIQVRINQITGGDAKAPTFHHFKRDALIWASGLEGTDKTNRTMANKRLLKKLAECKKKGILKKIPQKIEEVVVLGW